MAGFDPYRKWLGIPPQEQPPNHYRLLGIGLFESDPDVISNAADRQMSHVRTFQSGAFAEIAQFILNELSAARVCLLDPQRKAEYDRWLQQTLPAGHALPPPPRMMTMPPGMVPEGGGATVFGGYPYAEAAPAPGPPPPPPPPPLAPWASPAPPIGAAGRAEAAGPRPIVVGPGGGQAEAAGGDFLAAVSAPATHHGHAVHHKKKKDSMQMMTLGIALTVLSLVLVLGFLAAYMSENSPLSPPSGDQPLIGPGAPTIYKQRPATRTGRKPDSDRAVERPVQPVAKSAPPAPAKVRHVEESYDDIPVVPGVDRSAPVVPRRNPQPAGPPRGGPPNAGPPAGGAANPEPSGLDPDLRKDSLDKAVH